MVVTEDCQQVLMVSKQALVESMRCIMQEMLATIKEEEINEQAKKQEEDQLLTTKEAMQYCGVVRSTIWKWCQNNYLKPVRKGVKKKMYKLSDLKRVSEMQERMRA